MGKFSPWYIGIWIPDEPCQLSWTIFSNGIKLDTLEGVIKVKAAERNDNQGIPLYFENHAYIKLIIVFD